MNRQDRIVGIALVLVGSALLAETFSFKVPDWEPLGMAFWPRVLIGCIAAASVYFIVLGSVVDEPARPLQGRAFGTLTLGLLYALALVPLGFLVATPLFMAAFSLMLAGRISRRHVLEAIATAAMSTAAIHFVFQNTMGLELPPGVLGS